MIKIICLHYSSLHLLFSVVERLSRFNDCLNLPLQCLLVLVPGLLSERLLLVPVVKDGRHVLSVVASGAVVVVPKHLEQILVAGHRRIVLKIYGLSVVPLMKKRTKPGNL